MRLEKRKVVLIVDNAGTAADYYFLRDLILLGSLMLLFPASHALLEDVVLTNVRLEFLPPNCTSELQPLDAGIIHAAKAAYRRFFLEQVICAMDLVI
jgi:DDE superfamily endonuclease